MNLIGVSGLTTDTGGASSGVVVVVVVSGTVLVVVVSGTVVVVVVVVSGTVTVVVVVGHLTPGPQPHADAVGLAEDSSIRLAEKLGKEAEGTVADQEHA